MIEVRIEGGLGDYRQDGADTVLRAALRAGVGFPYECNSGGCGSCKFELLEGEVDNLWREAPGLSDRDRRKGRLLACQCRALTNLRIKARPSPEYVPAIVPQRRQATLVGTSDVTHDIRELRFATKGRAEFNAGQYASLAIPGVSSRRCYSMSNLPNERGEWHFQIRRVPDGQASNALFEHFRPGQQVELDGPYGLAWLREDCARDIVCVAGGSGLAPMVSIARRASSAGMLKNRHLHFYYGARTPRDVAGESLLRELPEFGSHLHYYPVVSLPEQDASATWAGETGYVHEAVRRGLDGQMANFEFYFAGPPPMTQALQEMLMVAQHVPFAQIHFDRFF